MTALAVASARGSTDMHSRLIRPAAGTTVGSRDAVTTPEGSAGRKQRGSSANDRNASSQVLRLHDLR
jgi:hypothetical protein